MTSLICTINIRSVRLLVLIIRRYYFLYWFFVAPGDVAADSPKHDDATSTSPVSLSEEFSAPSVFVANVKVQIKDGYACAVVSPLYHCY